MQCAKCRVAQEKRYIGVTSFEKTDELGDEPFVPLEQGLKHVRGCSSEQEDTQRHEPHFHAPLSLLKPRQALLQFDPCKQLKLRFQRNVVLVHELS